MLAEIKSRSLRQTEEEVAARPIKKVQGFRMRSFKHATLRLAVSLMIGGGAARKKVAEADSDGFRMLGRERVDGFRMRGTAGGPGPG